MNLSILLAPVPSKFGETRVHEVTAFHRLMPEVVGVSAFGNAPH